MENRISGKIWKNAKQQHISNIIGLGNPLEHTRPIKFSI